MWEMSTWNMLLFFYHTFVSGSSMPIKAGDLFQPNVYNLYYFQCFMAFRFINSTLHDNDVGSVYKIAFSFKFSSTIPRIQFPKIGRQLSQPSWAFFNVTNNPDFNLVEFCLHGFLPKLQLILFHFIGIIAIHSFIFMNIICTDYFMYILIILFIHLLLAVLL